MARKFLFILFLVVLVRAEIIENIKRSEENSELADLNTGETLESLEVLMVQQSTGAIEKPWNPNAVVSNVFGFLSNLTNGFMSILNVIVVLMESYFLRP